jgi:hypothetical protein
MHGVDTSVKKVPNTPDFPHHHLPVLMLTHLFILKMDKGPSHAAVNNIHSTHQRVTKRPTLKCGSLKSVVSKVGMPGWTIDRSRFDSGHGQEFYLFFEASRPNLGPNQTPIQRKQEAHPQCKAPEAWS